MSDQLNLTLTLAHGLSVMALTAVAFGQIERTRLSFALRSLAEGAVFGLAAILAMLSPVYAVDGATIDLRNIFIGLAGAFSGPTALALSALMAASARFAAGHTGILSDFIGIALAGIIGLTWRYLVRPLGLSPITSLAALGIMISIASLSWFVLPDDIGPALFFSSAPTMSVVSLIASVALGSFIERELGHIRVESRLRDEAATDALTGLLTRRAFEARLEEAWARPGKSRQSALLIIDIDHFKSVNDVYGHAMGDEVLKLVSGIVRNCVRHSDAVGRLGGEEFAVFLPGAYLQQARMVASRIREAVESARPYFHGVAVPITVSIGANWLPAPEHFDTYFAPADAALYCAKKAGRNRVEFASNIVTVPAVPVPALPVPVQTAA